MTNPTGVHQTSEGWVWRCDQCGQESASPVSGRAAARDAYKIHRLSHRKEEVAVQPSEQQEPAQEVKEPVAKKKTTAKKKTVPKKAVKKKAVTQKKTAKKAPAAAKGEGKIWRIGVRKSHTGRLVTPNVNSKGEVFACHAEQLGFERVASFATVRAPTRKEALALIKAKDKSVKWTGKAVAL